MKTTATLARHATGAVLESLILAALIVALLLSIAPFVTSEGSVPGVGTANAAKYWLEVNDGAFATTTQAEVYGDRTDYWVKAKCFQNGNLVYYEVVTADASGHATLTLGPTPNWASGSADCAAEAGYHGRNLRWHRVATTTFAVAGD